MDQTIADQLGLQYVRRNGNTVDEEEAGGERGKLRVMLFVMT